MKNRISTITTCALFAGFWLASTVTSRATPYATGLTNTGSRVSFRLNESADSVKLVYDGGATVLNLGAVKAGVFSTNVAVTGVFQVDVSKAIGLGYLHGVSNLVSADSNAFVRFNSPRGVAINRNPASPYFGRIYVANSDVGTVGTRSLGDGIYLLNADFSDALGQSNTARTAGLTFTNAVATDSANKPFRLEVGEDDNLFVSDYSASTGNLFVTDPDVTSGTNVFGFDAEKAGRIPSSAIVRGSLAGGNLSVVAVYPDKNYEYDFFGFPSTSFSVVQRWDIGSGPLPSAAAPVRITDLPILIADVPAVLSDLDIAPDGKLYIAQNRFAGLEPGLFVVDPNADNDGSGYPDIIFNSLGSSLAFFGATNDLLLQTRAVKVSPDGKTVALVRDDSKAWIIQVNNGLPDLASRRVLNSGNVTLGRDISFDAAGNLYIVSSGEGGLRVFSPGYPSRAITGSDGTFSVTRTTGDTVHLTMGTTNLSESGGTGSFTISRDGALAGSLTVGLAFSGTATRGADYTVISTNVALGPGVASMEVTVTPLDDILGEPLETIVVSVVSSTNYFVEGAFSGPLFIADDGDPPTVSLTAVDTNLYERMPNDTGVFRLFRQAGDVSGKLDVTLAITGTAVNGTDYQQFETLFTFPPGVASVTTNLVPIDNVLLDGPRMIVITVDEGEGYNPLPGGSSGTFLIRDDEVPPGPVLFSDDFDEDTSASYAVRFGANNANLDDKTVNFAWNYSAAGIPSAPHSVGNSTKGLKVNVNKDATAAIAGVNAYPVGVSFSNDYALRFDMYLTYSSLVAGTTEHSSFGLNHSGINTNRHATGGSDGVWFAVETDGSGSGGGRSYTSYTTPNPAAAPAFTPLPATQFAPFFTVPPHLASGAPSGQWVDVEVGQTNNVITWKINAVVIQRLTNSTPSTSGTIMLGYMDTFASIGSTNNYVVFDNVRVVGLNTTPAAPVITGIHSIGATVEIDFTAGASDSPEDFTLESSTALPGGFGPDAGSTISGLGAGLFRATSYNVEDRSRFYIIKR